MLSRTSCIIHSLLPRAMSPQINSQGYDIQKADEVQKARGGGGKFNASKAKSELDWVIYRAGQSPGPGGYDVRKAEEAQKAKGGGGKFNASVAKSERRYPCSMLSSESELIEQNFPSCIYTGFMTRILTLLVDWVM